MTKKIRVQPLGENVLVRLEAKEKKTAAGLFLPESVSGEREQQGVVVAVGTDKAIEAKKGDTVIFKRYGTNEDIKIGDAEHVLLNYKDILAVVLTA